MPRRASTRALAAVLFTDIVDSSAVASRLGDARWKELIARHHAIVRRELKRFGGKELDTAGDGFFASFTEPAAAIRCACAASEAVRELGIEIRAGVHFGECEQVGEKLGGIAVVVGARVMSLGGAGDVLVTATTRDLVAGAGFGFQDRGSHSLKGVDGEWHVLAVTEVDGEPRIQPAAPEEAERRLAEVQPSSVLSRGWFASRPWAVGVGIALVLALIAVSIPLLRSEAGGPIDVGTNSVTRLSGGNGSLELDPTALGQRPGATAIGFGSLWVAKPDEGLVARISLEDGSVTDPNIEVGTAPAGIAVGDGSVWVTNSGDGTVMRIDPASGDVTQEVPVGTAPSGVAFGDGALWITDSITAELIRFDPASGEETPTFLAGRPSGVAFTPDGVWVAVAPAGVARVDPTDLTVTLPYKEVGNGPAAVLSAFGSIWVANHLDGTLSRVDPSTASVQATIPVGEGPSALAEAGGSVWVANESDGSITRIDPASSTGDPPVPVGSAAVSLVAEADGGPLWLAAGASATEHRGGTLVVSSLGEAPPSLDPASVFYADEIAGQILAMTNDGLLSFKKVGGADGATLVPNLASALPEVSADGRTYRFPLREGIRYSTGDPVRPEDFRYALERVFSLNPDSAGYFSSIDGAKGCLNDPSTCELSIDTDAGSVTFNLTEPDPDLPFKLALPAAFPVPATTPIEDQGLAPVPATGPYEIAEAGSDRFELVRNEAFDARPAGAQPEGFVDAISWRFEQEVGTAFDQLETGEVDLMTDDPMPKDFEFLAATNPDRVAQWPRSQSYYVGMNLSEPPFDDPRVRQALNLAIDRRHVVDLLGGPAAERLTCQILPPNFQGYEPFCPYTLDPGSGVWSAPDVDAARALIADVDAAGTRVTLWVNSSFPPEASRTMTYVVEVLNELGMRANLKVLPDERYWPGIYETGEPQGFWLGWIPGYPSAGEYLGPLFECGSGANATGVCDAALDDQIQAARAKQATDPAAANLMWTEIEHQLVEDAVWVPLANPVTNYALSTRVGNVQVNPMLGILFSQLWVR